jgi:predicted nucleotidyltransferase
LPEAPPAYESEEFAQLSNRYRRMATSLLDVNSQIVRVEKLAGVEFFLYGSCARGEEREESDIDLLVIGKRTEEIIKILSVLEKKTGRTVRASFYSQLEWSRTAREDPAFYERVEKDKIRLI